MHALATPSRVRILARLKQAPAGLIIDGRLPTAAQRSPGQAA